MNRDKMDLFSFAISWYSIKYQVLTPDERRLRNETKRRFLQLWNPEHFLYILLYIIILSGNMAKVIKVQQWTHTGYRVKWTGWYVN